MSGTFWSIYDSPLEHSLFRGLAIVMARWVIFVNVTNYCSVILAWVAWFIVRHEDSGMSMKMLEDMSYCTRFVLAGLFISSVCSYLWGVSFEIGDRANLWRLALNRVPWRRFVLTEAILVAVLCMDIAGPIAVQHVLMIATTVFVILPPRFKGPLHLDFLSFRPPLGEPLSSPSI